MSMLVVFHGIVLTETTHSLLEILRRYPRWTESNKDRRSAVCNAEDLESDPTKCCEKCPPGYYYASECRGGSVAGAHCRRCGSRTYIEEANRLPKCHSCSFCDELGNAVKVKNCTHNQNTQCGCKEGYYVYSQSLHNLICYECSVCNNPSQCPQCPEKSCEFNFYRDHQNTCQPCTQNDFEKPGCQHHLTTPPIPTTLKPAKQDTHILVFCICMVMILILGGLLCCFLNFCSCCEWAILRWKKTGAPKQSYKFPSVQDLPQVKGNASLSGGYSENHKDHPTEVSRASQQMQKTYLAQDTTIEMLMNTGVCSSATSLMKDTDPKPLGEDPCVADSWPASVLYTIIREVPARRWKEFLRLLSVTDVQMERVEMEAGPCYLEQQYQMLRLWSRSGGAELETVFSALHSMNLSGCAQELQEKLQQLQQQQLA